VAPVEAAARKRCAARAVTACSIASPLTKLMRQPVYPGRHVSSAKEPRRVRPRSKVEPAPLIEINYSSIR
jgi:hypothetical protein